MNNIYEHRKLTASSVMEEDEKNDLINRFSQDHDTFSNIDSERYDLALEYALNIML